MGKLIQQYSWEETQLGTPTAWPESLKTTLSLILNSKFPMFLFWGPDHVCFYNDSYRPSLGVNGKHPWALGKAGAQVWPETWAVIKPLIDSVLLEGKSTWHEDQLISIFRNNSFEDAFWTFSYSPVYEKEGVSSGVLVTCTETTAKVKSIKNLKNSEQKFQNFVRQAPVGMIVLIGEEMRVEVVNEMYGLIIGRTLKELLNKNLFDIIPEAENDFRPVLDNVRLTQKPLYQYDCPYFVLIKGKRKEGFLNLVYQPYREPNETVSGVMVLCHDVTEQVKNRKQIEEEEAKARLAIESADLGTYEINLITDEIRTSERFNAIWGGETGFSREQFASLIHPDDHAIREAAHKESIKTGNLHYEVRVICKGRPQRWVRVKGKVLYDVNHKAINLLGVIQDITEQKNFADELSKLVEERTKELQTLNEELVVTNEEFSETNSHLIRANKDLEEFAYVASHDLQEPLRKIQTFANIIDERFAEELSEEASGYLAKVTSSARRMSNLIKDLLDYSRLTYNDSLFQSLDLNEILKNVINDFELLITQKEILIDFNKLPIIEAIPIQMNQLFYNLIGNAVKFSRKTVTPEIKIFARPLQPEEVKQFPGLKFGKPYHEIKIADNGIGFSQQYADQIFTIFQRLNNKAIYGGYGIGLALCRKIIENHNGVIFANGRENEGATFTVILPENHTSFHNTII